MLHLREFSSLNQRTILLPFLLLLIIISSIWLCWDGPTAHASGMIIYVKEGGSGSKNGSSWANAYDDLQKAIDSAPSGSQIWIAKGTYYPTREEEKGDPSTRTFFMKAGVSIYGGFAGSEGVDYDIRDRDFETNETILDGNDEVYCVVTFWNIPDESITLDGVTITGAHNNRTPSRAGGGLLLHYSSPTIRNVVIRDNYSKDYGAGVFSHGGSPTIENVQIHDNHSYLGAGGIHSAQTPVTLKNVDIYNNQGNSSGGATVYGSSSVNDVRIYNNTTSHTNGGLTIVNGQNGTFTNLKIYNNTCLQYCRGNAIFFDQAKDIKLFNVLIHGHSGVAPSLLLVDSRVDLVNATIIREDPRLGAAVQSLNPSIFNISNSMIWNTPSFMSGTVNVSHSIVQGSGGSGAWKSGYGVNKGGNLDIDPQFVNPSEGDFRIQVDSPAVDWGDDSKNSLSIDLAGNPRKVGTIDLGAYEVRSEDFVQAAIADLQIGYGLGDSDASVTQDILLPDSGIGGTSISWTSSDPEVIASDGTVIRPHSSSTDAIVTLTATISKGGVSDSKRIELTVKKKDGADPDKSSIFVNEPSDVVVGQAGMVTVKLIDQHDHPVDGVSVRLSGSPDGAYLSITPHATVTDGKGELSFTVSSTLASTITFSAEADGIHLAESAVITFVADAQDAHQSNVQTNRSTLVADGVEQSEITVTVKDLYENPIVGKAVKLKDDTGNSEIKAIQAVTDSNGIATFAVASEVAEKVTYTAEVDGVTIAQTAIVYFTVGDVDIKNSTIHSDQSVVRADGIQAATLFVTLQDASGNPVDNQFVELIQTVGTSTISPSTGMTDQHGVAQFKVMSTKPEKAQYQARLVATNQMIDAHAEVTFAGILSSNSQMTLIEGGEEGSYHITLNSMPTDTVTIAVYGGDKLIVSQSELIFTPLNWNISQSVSIQAKNHLLQNGTETQATVTHTVYSDDPIYHHFHIPEVEVFILKAAVTELNVDPAVVSLDLHGNRSQQLTVEAILSNGRTVDVTGSHTGTIYTCSDPETATVTEEGLIEAKRAGRSTITVTNSDMMKTVIVTVTRPSSGGSDRDVSEHTPSDDPDEEEAAAAELFVNGKSIHAGIITRTMRNHQHVISITLDSAVLGEVLAEESEGAKLTIPVLAPSDAVIAIIDGELFKILDRTEVSIELVTEQATYTLPVQQINIDAVMNPFSDAALQDIEVRIEISSPTQEYVRWMESTPGMNELSIIAPPQLFTVTIVHEGQQTEITTFRSYIERTIAIPHDVDPNQVTTAVVIETDGTVRHVPTKVDWADGRHVARIYSLTNSAYVVVSHTQQFTDVVNHWAQETINNMGSRMIVSGTGDGMFRPDRDISRAEFAAIMVRGLGLRPSYSESHFIDVNLTDWYNGVIQTAFEYGLIQGFDDHTFRPNEKITREQAMLIVSKAMEITGLRSQNEGKSVNEELSKFVDIDHVSNWALNGVADSVGAGVISGRSREILAPKELITRAEVATMLQRLLQKSDLINE